MPNTLTQSLEKKLNKTSLDLFELREGLTECFQLTNRQFVAKRIGTKQSIEEIDRTTQELVHQIYSELGLFPGTPTRRGLAEAWRQLDEQLGFEAEPVLLDHHRHIIQQLFDLVQASSEG